MKPTFAIVMGVAGRERSSTCCGLRTSLDSIARQERVLGDRVIVCVDSFEQGPRLDVQELVESYGDGFEYVHFDAGYHFFGVEQCNYATKWVETVGVPTTHLMSMGDDDVLVDGTFAALRQVCAEHPKRVIISREFLGGYGLIWEIPAMRRCHVSGQCMLAPLPVVGYQDTRHDCTVDFDWMVGAIERSGEPALFVDFVSTIAHTDGSKRGVWRCQRCARYGLFEKASASFQCCGEPVNRTPAAHVVEEVAALV